MTARPAETCIEVHNDKTRKTKNKTLVNNFSLHRESYFQFTNSVGEVGDGGYTFNEISGGSISIILQ